MMKHKELTPRHWLCNTTCQNYGEQLRVFGAGNRFWLMKHKGHSSYINSWAGSSWCGAYYTLYDMEHLYHQVDFAYGPELTPKQKPLGHWLGRWTKTREMELLGILSAYGAEENV